MKLTLCRFLEKELGENSIDLLVCDAWLSKFVVPCANRLSKHLVIMNITLPVKDVSQDGPGHLEVVLCPYEFEMPDSSQLARGRHYGEPSIYRNRETNSFPWNRLADNKPLIYCSFGSQTSAYALAAQAYQCLVDSFAELPGFRFVLVAKSSYQASLPPFPDNVIVVESAPQLQLLERAAAFVTHGGLGSVKESVMAGVPMLVMPFAVDQPKNAQRVEHHKLGYACPLGNCTPRRIAEMLGDLVSNRTIAQNIHAMSSIFNDAERAAPVSAILQRLVSQ
jgi:MGT family glycosyltransferase